MRMEILTFLGNKIRIKYQGDVYVFYAEEEGLGLSLGGGDKRLLVSRPDDDDDYRLITTEEDHEPE